MRRSVTRVRIFCTRSRRSGASEVLVESSSGDAVVRIESGKDKQARSSWLIRPQT